MMPNGLKNKGNSCYINAALQTITSIISDIFINGEYVQKIKKDENINKFLFNFAHLLAAVENINEQWSEKHVNLYLQYFFTYLKTLDNFKRFVNFQQEDSYEFLSELIQLLSDYLKYKVMINIQLKVDEKDLDDKDKIRLNFYNHLKLSLKYTSIFEERIRGHFRAIIICGYEDCKYISEKFEPFLSLSLPINKLNTLKECLEHYVKPITLDEKNQWVCNKCNRKTKAVKKLSIWNTSKYIIISYKRYSNNNLTIIKDCHPIITPLENLDFSPYVEDNNKNENKYSLCSITIHKGSMKSGHYVNFRKISNDWFLFDDNKVTRVDMCDIDINFAYYLVYRRNV